MSHKYQLHQMVRLTRSGFSDNRASSSGHLRGDAPHAGRPDRRGLVSDQVVRFGERAVRESEITARVSDT